MIKFSITTDFMMIDRMGIIPLTLKTVLQHKDLILRGNHVSFAIALKHFTVK